MSSIISRTPSTVWLPRLSQMTISALLQHRAELGLYISQESFAVHGSIQAPRGNQAFKTEACNESHGFPVTAGSVVMASLSHRAAAMPPGHVRACSRFIEKDQAAGSHVFCQSRQRRLAAATSARSCSLARSVFL